MQFKNYLLFTATLLFSCTFYGQVGIGTTNPSPKAMLEVSSTSDAGATYRGMMPPRVPNNTARNSINPSAGDIGLMIFVESTQCLQMWSGTEWQNVKCITVPSEWPAIHNFETTAADNELPLFSASGGFYTSGNGDFPNSPLYVSPSRGYGVSNTTATVILGPIDVSSATTATFKLRLASFSRTLGNGMDNTDLVTVSISTMGPSGPFSEELQIIGGTTGTSQNQWGFNALRSVTTTYSSVRLDVFSGGGLNVTTGGISYLEITGIPNSENLAIKIVITNNQTNEIWVIDEAEVWGN